MSVYYVPLAVEGSGDYGRAVVLVDIYEYDVVTNKFIAPVLPERGNGGMLSG
jgi:hypothetical protein